MAHKKIILLVEDNPDNELPTLRAFQHNRISNEIFVARPGVYWLLLNELPPAR